MKPQLQAAALVVALLIMAFALGLEFGGSGLSGGNSGANKTISMSSKGKLVTLPVLVLRAEGVNPVDLYGAAHLQNVSSPMSVPLSGLRATVTSLSKSSVPGRGRPPSLTLTTNSSGIAETIELPGNYSVAISTAYYSLNTVISIALNTTTTLTVNLRASAEAVETLRIVSPDSMGVLGPEAKLYALVDNASGPARGFAELVGYHYGSYASSGITILFSPLVEANATVIGGYPGTSGFWAALTPLESYSAFPTIDVMLFQYEPVSQVTYTAI